MFVGDRRDVGDDQAVDGVGPGEGEDHRRLAAHGMPENVEGAVQPVDHLGEVGGHLLVAMRVGPRTRSMVAHVDGDDPARVGEPLRDGSPVSGGSEEAVRDQQPRPGAALAMEGEVQHDARPCGRGGLTDSGRAGSGRTVRRLRP